MLQNSFIANSLQKFTLGLISVFLYLHFPLSSLILYANKNRNLTQQLYT